jgi:ATP-binding cassette subfamily B protein
MVVLRSLQLPALTWLLASIIGGPVAAGDTGGVARGTVLFAALAASTHVVMHFRLRLALELGEGVVHDLRRDAFERLHALTLDFFHRTPLGSIVSRMSTDIEQVRIGVQDVFFVCVVLAGQMAVAGGCMLWYDPVLFGIVLGSAPLLWTTNQRFHRRISRHLRDARESLGRVTATLTEAVDGIRVTQAFVRYDMNSQVFRERVAAHAQHNLAVARTQAVFLPLMDLTCQACLAALLLVGGWRALQAGPGELANLVAFLFMAHLFFAPITLFAHQYNQALSAMAGAERVFRLLDTEPAWREPPGAVDLPELTGRVEFRGVSFRYLPDRPVLDEISFVVGAGQTVALVGPTGSGKTTITSLIAKLYLPDFGQILLDGRDFGGATAASLCRQLAVVPQHPFLFDGTILDNIRFARPDASAQQVAEVLQRLDCQDLFEALPGGMQTEVGQRGLQLSLGQRQLVCFARAMLVDPRILILDEATSSVDPLTERRIEIALSRLTAGRTSFIIAHRLTTLRRADLLLVVASGRIVERGTLHELLEAGGVYAGLHKACAEHGIQSP